ncbi:MAG TPA: O-antigen ligase family protein [Gemmatimonadales bacterium]
MASAALPSVLPMVERRAAAANAVLRALLYLTVASFPFEMPDLHLRWQAPQLTSSLFLVGTMLQPMTCYRRMPVAIWAFVAFLFAFGLSVARHEPIDAMDVAQDFVLVVQGIMIFWAASNLLQEERVARGALWAMAVGAFVWAMLPMLGLGRTEDVVWTGGTRITAFGQNANRAAVLISAGMLALFSLTHGRIAKPGLARLLVWPVLALMAVAVEDTGSRGGLLALIGGLLVFLVLNRAKTLGGRLRVVLIGAFAIGALAYTASQTEVMRNRLEDTAETGTMAGREDLYPALWDMFLERPITGWGPDNNQYEVTIRAPMMDKIKRDAHNLVLELLTSTGIVGAIPFLAGLAWCIAAAWRARQGPHGVVPLALLTTFLIANMSGNHLAFKPFWFSLAFAVAAAAVTVRPPASETAR